MGIIDTIGIIGELLAWIGVIVGIPFWVAAVVIRACDGPRCSTTVRIVTIVDGSCRERIALWHVNGLEHRRSLTVRDNVGDTETADIIGYVRQRRHQDLTFHRRSHPEQICRTVTVTMLSAAAVGLVASLLPLFW